MYRIYTKLFCVHFENQNKNKNQNQRTNQNKINSSVTWSSLQIFEESNKIIHFAATNRPHDFYKKYVLQSSIEIINFKESCEIASKTVFIIVRWFSRIG